MADSDMFKTYLSTSCIQNMLTIYYLILEICIKILTTNHDRIWEQKTFHEKEILAKIFNVRNQNILNIKIVFKFEVD